ncbi:MAG TPA: protease pro-enzyme activation domain-containing protein [Geobacteraceae bacterium]|nr:protease pro-enzyme activation domain-containing protein [Geobacteraceae bacterium]
MLRRLAFIITVLLGLAANAVIPAFAASLRVIDDSDTVVCSGNVHPLARSEFDKGPTDPSLKMERMILSLRMDPARQAALDRLLAEQQDPASPSYHKWLSPEEFGERFGPEPADVEAITRWLTVHGFTVEEVARGRTWTNFSGTVSSVESAFHTEIHDYQVNGRLHHANSRDPSIPRGLADLVSGIVSLHNFPRKAMNSGLRTMAAGPDYTSGSTHYLAPGDFATIYNVNALYGAGIDGSGQSIAIVGRTHPSDSNWSTFRSIMGLSANPPQVIVNGTDPGDLGGGEDNEADLDVEWSGAVAKNATIMFVTSQSTSSTDGVDLSAQYIVNNNLAPVMSTSFGACEADLGSTERSFYNSIWQQAASQGITAFVSSGDAGAAGCNSGSDSSGSGKAVNGLASSPYNIAVGGTQFNEGSGNYWNSTNSGYTSALGYIPEAAWNESGSVSGGSGLWSTGGGKSAYYAKPSWQTAVGVPNDGKRDVPDVSLSAAMHDGYLVETQGALYSIGGTSASSPSFAGLMALIVQKTGQRQGNANTRFYQLANAQYGSGGVTIFHDTISGNNTVPGVTGYSCTTGYDRATGLGSVDASALVNNWLLDFTITPTPTAISIPQRSSGTVTITTTVWGNFNSSVVLSASGLPTGASASLNPAAIPAPGTGSSVLTITTDSAAAGIYPLSITGIGGGMTHAAAVNLTIIPVFEITASVANGGGSITPASAAVVSGGSVAFTVTPATGYYLASLIDSGVDVTAAVSGDSYTIANVVAPHTIVATFAADTYSVTASVNGGGGTISPASSTIAFGGNITLTITPSTGYTLGALTDNGSSVGATANPDGSYTYAISNVTANHAVIAAFTPNSAAAVPALPPFVLSAALFFITIMGSAGFRKRSKG